MQYPDKTFDADIDRIRSESTLSPHQIPKRELLYIALKIGLSVDELIGKTKSEVVDLMRASALEDVSGVEETVTEILASVPADEKPLEIRVRFALSIGLRKEDLMGLGYKELHELIDRQLVLAGQNRRYDAMLSTLAKFSGISEEDLRRQFPSWHLLLEFREATELRDVRPVSEQASMTKQSYKPGTLLSFVYGSMRTGKQSGTATVVECKDTGYVIVQVLEAEPYQCSEVKSPLKRGKKIR